MLTQRINMRYVVLLKQESTNVSPWFEPLAGVSWVDDKGMKIEFATTPRGIVLKQQN